MPQLTTCFPPSRSLLAAPPTCLQASAHQENILCQLVIVLFRICQTLSWGENITTEDDKIKHKSEYGTQGGIRGLAWRTARWLRSLAVWVTTPSRWSSVRSGEWPEDAFSVLGSCLQILTTRQRICLFLKNLLESTILGAILEESLFRNPKRVF